jgi:hypothetical protein
MLIHMQQNIQFTVQVNGIYGACYPPVADPGFEAAGWLAALEWGF